jgi:hypothetical protein
MKRIGKNKNFNYTPSPNQMNHFLKKKKQKGKQTKVNVFVNSSPWKFNFEESLKYHCLYEEQSSNQKKSGCRTTLENQIKSGINTAYGMKTIL